MREIEFRAWDSINKTYIYATLGDLICGTCTESGDKKLSGNNQIWEQDTGITDRNGKKIYDGDIVSVYEGRYVGSIVQHPGGEWRIIWVRPQGTADSLYGYRHECEVIGNVHDNPELLEDRNN